MITIWINTIQVTEFENGSFFVTVNGLQEWIDTAIDKVELPLSYSYMASPDSNNDGIVLHVAPAARDGDLYISVDTNGASPVVGILNDNDDNLTDNVYTFYPMIEEIQN